MQDQHQLAVWNQQRSIARYILLGTVIATAVDLLLLFSQADFYIPYCAFFPYFLTSLGLIFDGLQISTFTYTGTFLAFLCLAGYLLVWWFAKRRNGWLLTGMILVILDTVVLLLAAFLFFGNPGEFLLDILLHLAVIYELAVGLRAGIQLKRAEQAPPPAVFDDSQTEAQSEYSDLL